MRVRMSCVAVALLLVAADTRAAGAPEMGERGADWESQVRETERAFAKTMAGRDHAAFVAFLAQEAVFLSAKGPLRGREAVAAGWKPYFEGPHAAFSWEPEHVAVVESGTLALSSGPVRDPEGRRVGTFTSTWRREADGKWRIVLDSGCPPCECPASGGR